MDISAGLAAIKAGIGLTQTLRETVKKSAVQPDEVAARLLEVIDLLMDAKISLADAHEKMSALKIERDDALRLVSLVDDMELTMDGHFYIRKSEKSKGLIPYCPVCWSVDRKAVHLVPASSPGLFSCRLHSEQETLYETAEFKAYWAAMNR